MRERNRECKVKLDTKKEERWDGRVEGMKVRKRCRECEENREGRKKSR